MEFFFICLFVNYFKVMSGHGKVSAVTWHFSLSVIQNLFWSFTKYTKKELTWFIILYRKVIFQCSSANDCDSCPLRGDHTETVDVDYDPQETDFSALLKIFWKNHDPTSNCTRQVRYVFYFDKSKHRYLSM